MDTNRMLTVILPHRDLYKFIYHLWKYRQTAAATSSCNDKSQSPLPH